MLRADARAVAFSMAVACLAGNAQALETGLELVMVERDGCPWCVRWDREVGVLYGKTPEGKIAPLRKVNLDRPAGGPLSVSPPVRYTPTFVLMDGGREIGRITGYLGDDAFWGLYSKMLRDWQAKQPGAH